MLLKRLQKLALSNLRGRELIGIAETEGNFPGLMLMPFLKVPAFVVCVCVCVIMLCDWLLSLDFA